METSIPNFRIIWGDEERTGISYDGSRQCGCLRWLFTHVLHLGTQEGLIPFYAPGQIFQQDNAPIHTAEDVKEWLEKYGVQVLDWSPYSPDLNPVEHIWWRLKPKVFELYPELERQGATQEALNNLISACKEAWNSIGMELIKAVVDSMPQKIQEVIKANG